MNKNLMRVLAIKSSRKAHPTGDPKFAVMQAFPAEFSSEATDPFLMCDFFSSDTMHKARHVDDFPIDWHPHRGMDICTYLTEGLGRHGDSLGNREVFATPGMQWISVGSGIEHAEGGATASGEMSTGFQIWINVPKAHKMDDPVYGTEPPEKLMTFQNGPASGRLLAGTYVSEVGSAVGPFSTKQPLQMIDYTIPSNSKFVHSIPAGLDNCLLFIYAGSGKIGTSPVNRMAVVHLDASDPNTRSFEASSGDSEMKIMVFAGKKINEPIAWQGPFVMNTDADIRQTISEYRAGKFPPKRVPWDYKTLSTFPADHPARSSIKAEL